MRLCRHTCTWRAERAATSSAHVGTSSAQRDAGSAQHEASCKLALSTQRCRSRPSCSRSHQSSTCCRGSEEGKRHGCNERSYPTRRAQANLADAWPHAAAWRRRPHTTLLSPATPVSPCFSTHLQHSPFPPHFRPCALHTMGSGGALHTWLWAGRGVGGRVGGLMRLQPCATPGCFIGWVSLHALRQAALAPGSQMPLCRNHETEQSAGAASHPMPRIRPRPAASSALVGGRGARALAGPLLVSVTPCCCKPPQAPCSCPKPAAAAPAPCCCQALNLETAAWPWPSPLGCRCSVQSSSCRSSCKTCRLACSWAARSEGVEIRGWFQGAVS